MRETFAEMILVPLVIWLFTNVSIAYAINVTESYKPLWFLLLPALIWFDAVTAFKELLFEKEVGIAENERKEHDCIDI